MGFLFTQVVLSPNPDSSPKMPYIPGGRGRLEYFIPGLLFSRFEASPHIAPFFSFLLRVALVSIVSSCAEYALWSGSITRYTVPPKKAAPCSSRGSYRATNSVAGETYIRVIVPRTSDFIFFHSFWAVAHRFYPVLLACDVPRGLSPVCFAPILFLFLYSRVS
jgi:hypothetical protein